MAAPRKYPEELRERAIRMAVDLRRDPATKVGALKRVGDQLGINPETLRNWVGQAEIDEGHRPGVTTAEAQRITELEREVRELRRANEILRTASAFSPPRSSTARSSSPGADDHAADGVRSRPSASAAMRAHADENMGPVISMCHGA
jgi:transposase